MTPSTAACAARRQMGPHTRVAYRCPAATECAAFNASVGGNGTCVNVNPGGGCGGVAWSRVLVGSVLGGYIILYGQFQAGVGLEQRRSILTAATE